MVEFVNNVHPIVVVSISHAHVMELFGCIQTEQQKTSRLQVRKCNKTILL